MLSLPPSLRAEEKKPRPLMRDFIGLCVHTVQFKPELYKPVTRLLRDYHPFDWDIGKETNATTKFPMARNGVDWGRMYGDWKKAGYRTEASILFDNFPAKDWKSIPLDAFAYGRAFAESFGPSHSGVVEAMEIGNEPGKYDDATYRALFQAMATGARLGDPKLKVATCAANLGKSASYSKSVDLLAGLESLYDVLNIHNYPEVEPWPTWKRSYPEDPKIEFLRDIGHVLKWRSEHVPEKEVWLTEFGYDATSKPRHTTGDFAKWEGSTETQQALWTVRGFLVLAASGLDRAYLYFFNDPDEPQLHGSSGLTRNFVPKPAFHAVAHLQKSLGDYRLLATPRQSEEEGYLYEFQHETEQQHRVLVAWKTHGEPGKMTIPIGRAKMLRAERTPLRAGDPETVEWKPAGEGMIELEAGEAPVFLWIEG